MVQESVRPAVSVIMPAYNAEPFIADALHSIVGQTFHDFELIVIDDGSSDGTHAIIQAIRDPRLAVHRHSANLGESAAFNTGLQAARGEFVARMDADDIAEPGRLATQHGFMKSHQSVTVCGANMILFGDGTGTATAPTQDGLIKARFLAGMGNIFNPTAFFRRRFAIDFGIRYDTRFKIGPDLAFWIECMRHGAEFANIDLPLLRYRIRPRQPNAENDATMRRILANLAASFFPILEENEVSALANIFVVPPTPISAEEFRVIGKACEKAMADSKSYFGEDRRHLHEIVGMYRSAFIQNTGAANRKDAQKRFTSPRG
jgi:glycosyltransferase involved in cell wall biosynthesis